LRFKRRSTRIIWRRQDRRAEIKLRAAGYPDFRTHPVFVAQISLIRTIEPQLSVSPEIL